MSKQILRSFRPQNDEYCWAFRMTNIVEQDPTCDAQNDGNINNFRQNDNMSAMKC